MMAKELGLPPGALDGDQLIRIDFDNPRELNLRIPSGNEAGANDMWMPGGKMPGVGLEGVIDLAGVPPDRWMVTILKNR